ncbi:MAG TPA: hypothetical protein VKF59_00790 [Candidatus Dormibacteraeota bacterium]|nr:hypothetical protein [Candidatus Dormibacteraeota bacterium]
MRHPGRTDEITIRVPGPFAGVADLGFSARYPEQSLLEPLRDVPLWIEGPAEPMRRLSARLRMLATLVTSPHGWTQPVPLTEEVVIIAFQDRSGSPGVLIDAAGALDYAMNLIRPVVFPFLRDCAEVAHLRLTDRIDMTVRHAGDPLAELSLRWDQIVPANGPDLLSA